MTNAFNTQIKSLVLAFVASGTMLMVAAAPAKAASQEVVVKVSELSTSTGRADVQRRLERTARQVCSTDTDGRTTSAYRTQKACEAEALGKAQVQVAAMASKTLLAAK